MRVYRPAGRVCAMRNLPGSPRSTKKKTPPHMRDENGNPSGNALAIQGNSDPFSAIRAFPEAKNARKDAIPCETKTAIQVAIR